jgi:hypothetical protein
LGEKGIYILVAVQRDSENKREWGILPERAAETDSAKKSKYYVLVRGNRLRQLCARDLVIPEFIPKIKKLLLLF